MNVYVFDYVSQLTDNYHDSGGLVVVARNIDHVRELLTDYPAARPSVDEYAKVNVYPTNSDAKEAVYIFPDAGCC